MINKSSPTRAFFLNYFQFCFFLLTDYGIEDKASIKIIAEIDTKFHLYNKFSDENKITFNARWKNKL